LGEQLESTGSLNNFLKLQVDQTASDQVDELTLISDGNIMAYFAMGTCTPDSK
jgi:hypothetical protein